MAIPNLTMAKTAELTAVDDDQLVVPGSHKSKVKVLIF